MDLSIKLELILPALSLSRSDFAKVEREFLVADSTGQTAWLWKLLSIMGAGFESGSALLIDQSKGNKAANLQTHSRNPIELVSFPARFKTVAQYISAVDYEYIK